MGQARTDLGENAINAVRIRIVEEEDGEFVRGWMAESIRYKLWAECRTANADQKQIPERPVPAANGSIMHLGGERLNASDGLLDFFADGWRWRQGRVAQPIMTHHPVFVGIGDGTLFQLGHFGKGPLEAGLHRGEEIVREIHSAKIQSQAQAGELRIVPLEAQPEL